jgi:hypothetical protein
MERVRITRAKGDTPGKLKVRMPEAVKAATPAPVVTAAIPRSILDEEMIRRFCRLIKKGLPPDAVCDYLNISRSAFWNWITKGESFRNGDGEPKEYQLYGAFVGEFRRATALYRLRRLNALHRPGNNLWAREMTILERRDRKNFSRNEMPGGSVESIQPDERFL